MSSQNENPQYPSRAGQGLTENQRVAMAARRITGFLWDDQCRDFAETFGQPITPNDPIPGWLNVCEGYGHEWMEHLFYSLMVLASYFGRSEFDFESYQLMMSEAKAETEENADESEASYRERVTKANAWWDGLTSDQRFSYTNYHEMNPINFTQQDLLKIYHIAHPEATVPDAEATPLTKIRKAALKELKKSNLTIPPHMVGLALGMFEAGVGYHIRNSSSISQTRQMYYPSDEAIDSMIEALDRYVAPLGDVGLPSGMEGHVEPMREIVRRKLFNL